VPTHKVSPARLADAAKDCHGQRLGINGPEVARLSRAQEYCYGYLEAVKAVFGTNSIPSK